ncbi:MAG: DUF374 domain-containing protein [Pseudomonadota bacterium]
MKRFLRSGPVSAALGGLIWLYMALCARTIRWRVEGRDPAKALWAEGGPIIVTAWHSQILLLPSGWSRHMRRWPGRRAASAMMISLSAEGEPVARAIKHLGLESIRGSAASKRKRKDKGGAAAVAAALATLRRGGAVCVTPDGPRGPAREAAAGPALIARRADATLLPYALACRPAWRLNTWDRFVIPVPFARGAIVFGDSVRATGEIDTETVRAGLQRNLDAANQCAEALCARTAPKPSTRREPAQ